MTGKCLMWSICFYRMIHCGYSFSLPSVSVVFRDKLQIYTFSGLLWNASHWLLTRLSAAVHWEFNVLHAEERQGLLCIRALGRHGNFSEWDSLEWKCHVANRDNCFCPGNSCPCPGSVTQDGHLQPTCQSAAANMVADNWWGSRAGAGAGV